MKMTDIHKEKLLKIGDLCKSMRKLRGYTQKDVANEIKVPLNDVIAFENGRSNNAIILWWYFGTEFDGDFYEESNNK